MLDEGRESCLINTRRMVEKIGHKLWFHCRSTRLGLVAIDFVCFNSKFIFLLSENFCVIRLFFPLWVDGEKGTEGKQANEIEEQRKYYSDGAESRSTGDKFLLMRLLVRGENLIVSWKAVLKSAENYNIISNLFLFAFPTSRFVVR